MQIAKSARFYLERRSQDSHPTRRTPAPRLVPGAHPIHYVALVAPLPLPALLADLGHPPDAGTTIPWPHGEIDV